jgi:pullulanase-type alpha-1,6-glucosidase
VRGGNPFGGYQEQGFINGLHYDANEVEQRSEGTQRVTLLKFVDQIRVSLSGNLAEYSFANWQGQQVTGAEVDYNGSPSGYTLDPQEHICYISAHDNETLFDAIQYKAPAGATVADRVRMQNMGVSLVALSQGVPFFHAGTEMLRSKSFDRDSFDSGDWFNKLDFTYEDNNWGVGLPPASKNRDNWPIMRLLLARPELKPAPADITKAVAHFQETLGIRKSSPLFRLRTAQEVQERLRFHNTGLDQVLGMIVMSLSDVGTSTNLDPERDLILVVFNATQQEQRFTLSGLADVPLELHPVQAASSDALVQAAAFDREMGTFVIPGRTTAVFVAPQGTASDLRLGDGDKIEVEASAEPESTAEATAVQTIETAAEPTAPAAEPTEPPATPAPEEPEPSALAWPWLVAVLAAVGGAVVWGWRRFKQQG